MLPDPRGIRRERSGVHDHKEVFGVPAEHRDVVQHPALLVQQETVTALAVPHGGNRLGCEGFEILLGIWAAELEFAHVAGVENGCVHAWVNMLRNDASVLNRHLPPGKGPDPGIPIAVCRVQRSSLHARIVYPRTGRY